MRRDEPSRDAGLVDEARSSRAYLQGPLAPFLSSGPVHEIGDGPTAAPGLHPVVFSAYRLQDLGDYRAALQGWFEQVAVGGVLVMVAPHAWLFERQNALPSRWRPAQKRLYTPASLMAEVEEALEPNSYRVRHLGDEDAGYDYAVAVDQVPSGRHEVAVVIEKIAPPSWRLASGPSQKPPATRPLPPSGAEPAHTRVEEDRTLPAQRILALKLDHLGDFIMGLPALEKLRAAFPQAHITLVVGPWNVDMAKALGLFDRVASFDAFPRNSTEERADVRGTVSEFRRLFPETYDLAIDLRTDHDTRVLLEGVSAAQRCGLGFKTHYPFMDIFLPVDATRAGAERAWERDLAAFRFREHDCWRNHFEIHSQRMAPRADGSAIVWGPYDRLDPGCYLFEPHSEVNLSEPGLLRCDVALDTQRVVERIFSREHLAPLQFDVGPAGAEFEYRIFNVAGEAAPTFRFYGGRLVKLASNGVLHQSEYLSLLVELVAMRVGRQGVLQDRRAAA